MPLTDKDPVLPPVTKQRRLERAQQLINRFPKRRVKNICFQDEKDFTVHVPTNRQNDRIYIRTAKKMLVESESISKLVDNR